MADTLPRRTLTSAHPTPTWFELVHPRYEVHRCLATGGSCEVYAATDKSRAIDVALKVMRRADTEIERERQYQEAALAKSLHHENLCRCYDFIEGSDVAILVLELLEGETLRELLRREGSLGPQATNRVVSDVFRALEFMHDAGVVHRDIKPENLLLVPPGRATLIDFGLCKTRRLDALTGDGLVLGTPGYLSPEQLLGEAITPQTDIHGMGVLIFEMLSGNKAFPEQETVATTMESVLFREPQLDWARTQPRLRSFLERALNKGPTARFPDARSMARAWQRVMDEAVTLSENGVRLQGLTADE